MEKNVCYHIDGKPFEFTTSGEFFRGEAVTLIDHDVDLTEGFEWHQKGFCIRPFIAAKAFEHLVSAVAGFLNETVERITGNRLEDPEKYHQVVNDQQHREVIKQTYYKVGFDELGIELAQITKRMSEILGQPMTTGNPRVEDYGSKLILRLVRPKGQDNNPIHRDVWLDHLRDAINIYVPLWGSNQDSSLPLIPGSHLWKESQIERTRAGSSVAGAVYTVPTVTDSDFGLKAIRPNPASGEVLVFSPYLIHGGGRNENADVTRISLEMRFWRKDNTNPR